MSIAWQETILPVSYLRQDYKELDAAWIDTLVSDNASDTWKPISVLQQSQRVYIVKDGNHRAVAAKRLGLKKVLCELLVITE